MSNIFTYLVRSTLGALPVNIGIGAIVDPVKSQGLNIDNTGAVYAVADGVIDHYNQGLPFEVNGRLVVTEDPKVRVDQSVPFSAAGAMCLGAGGISYVSQGLAYTASGAIAFTGGIFPANLYLNFEFAGASPDAVGSDAGVPDNHIYQFDTCETDVIDNGDGTFDIVTNPLITPSVRRNLVYPLSTNNPALDVGATYRLSYDIIREGSQSVVGTVNSFANMTIVDTSLSAPNLIPTEIFVEILVDSLGYELQVRVGTGNNSNGQNKVTISNPTLFKTANAP